MRQTISNCAAILNAAVAAFVQDGNITSTQQFTFDAQAPDTVVNGTAAFVCGMLSKFGLTVTSAVGKKTINEKNEETGETLAKDVRTVDFTVSLPAENTMQFCVDTMYKLNFKA